VLAFPGVAAANRPAVRTPASLARAD
jgi:hypothetical protein